jgi:hypothetical protein
MNIQVVHLEDDNKKTIISSSMKKKYEQAIYQYKLFDKEQVERQKVRFKKRKYN